MDLLLDGWQVAGAVTGEGVYLCGSLIHPVRVVCGRGGGCVLGEMRVPSHP